MHGHRQVGDPAFSPNEIATRPPINTVALIFFGVLHVVAHVTRIAPSPTGMFHLGTARTALFNWLVAKATGGQFIVRIDDTDVARNTPEAINVIHESLDWLRFDCDLWFHQSDRLERYQKAAGELVKKDLAFVDGTAVRLRLPSSEGFHAWSDTITGEMLITDKEREVIDGMVLMRSDGFPTYHFASVYDDMDCGVTWVIRGTDHISNTPKHIAIWNALSQIGWNGGRTPKPLWTHVGLLTLNKKKLSKRDGAASVLSYRDQGIDPDALVNWMLRLGWGPSVDDKTTATISRDRAIELFLDGGAMRNSPSNMDSKLLESLDRKYKARYPKE